MMNLEEYAAYHNSRITDGKVPFHIVGDEVRYVLMELTINMILLILKLIM